MRQQELGVSGLLGPLELIKHFPGEPCAASVRRRWVGLEALRLASRILVNVLTALHAGGCGS